MIQLGRAASWALLSGILLGPALVATVLWSPFLASGRFRALFRRLPPKDSLVASYPIVVLGLWLPYLVGFLWTLSAGPREGSAAASNALLGVVFALTAVYTAGLPVLAVVGLPRLGVDWDPSGYGAGTWLLLVAGAFWYALVVGFPLFLFAAIVALPT